jgi:hypothetical protein
MGKLYLYIVSGIGCNGSRRASAMRKTYSVITILVIYLFSCIPAQAALVVCVRADGTARFVSVDHGCPNGADAPQECHTGASHKEGRESARHSISRDRCCQDYAVEISAGQIAPREQEKSAAASVDAFRTAHLAPDMACGKILPAELGPEQTFPTHLKTVILLI